MPSELSIDLTGGIGLIQAYTDSIILTFPKMRFRFNNQIEIFDAEHKLQTLIKMDGRTGDLAALRKLADQDVRNAENNIQSPCKIRMDAQAFRIILFDGTILQSTNILDVRQPNLAQVDFWTQNPADYYFLADPAPETVKHYPEILGKQA